MSNTTADLSNHSSGFEREVAGRFGVLPNFFRTAADAPGLIGQLWSFAKSAYLDNPLPSLFKERVFVYLSRFCEVRYCLIRHSGFLIGRGRPAGDDSVTPHAVQQLLALLRHPVATAATLDDALARLESYGETCSVPVPESQREADLLDALTILFLDPVRSERARLAACRCLGERMFEYATALLTFVRAAHYWTETHPQLGCEQDMALLMEEQPELARLLLNDPEAEAVDAKQQLQRAIWALHDAEKEQRDLRKALDTSESRMAAIFAQAGVGLSELTLDGRFLQVNEELCRILGRPQHDLLTLSITDVTSPEDLPRSVKTMAHVAETGIAGALDKRYLRPDGTPVWANSTVSLLRMDQTGSGTLLVVTVDVTARKESEEALRGSEARAQALVANLPHAAAFVVGHDLRYQLAGGEALEKAGFTVGSFLNRRLDEVLPPDLVESYVPIYRQTLAGQSFAFEHAAHGRFYLSRGVPLRDGSGDVYAALAVSYDITERVLAEQALRDSEEKLARELADTRQLQRVSSSYIKDDNIDALYQEILGVARALMRSDFASLQGLSPERNELFLLSQQGFSPEATRYWEWVPADHGTSCGLTFARGEAVMVPDIECWDVIAGTEDLRQYRLNGIRAMLSTPLISRDARLVGVITTHWHEPHHPSEREFRLLDVLARQAADLIERRTAEQALRASEERQAFLLKLSDALRPLSDPLEIQREAMRVIGEHLAADRVIYAEMEADDAYFTIAQNYVREGFFPLTGRFPTESFGPITAPLRAGETVVVSDVSTSELTKDCAAYAAAGIASVLGVPLVKKGRWLSNLSVHVGAPRVWREDEIALLQETADRTWAAVERARAEAALRESEERLRLALDAADMGSFLWRVTDDEPEPDARMLSLFGLSEPAKLTLANALKTLIHEEDGTRYGAAVARAVDPEGNGRLREDIRVLHSSGKTRWLTVAGQVQFAGDPWQPERMHGVVFDITARKETEEALRQSEERQAYLLKLSDALQPVEDPLDAQVVAVRVLGEHLGVDRAQYGEVLEDENTNIVRAAYASDDVLPLLGVYRFEDFGADIAARFRAGETVIVDDVAALTALSDDGRARYAEAQIAAWAGVPLVKGERLRAYLTVTSSLPRAWKATELALIRETAERTWASVERAHAEASLRKSEEQFRRALEKAPIPVIMHAEDGQVLQISRTWTELTGYGPEELSTFEAWLNQAYGKGANAVRHHVHELFQGTKRSINIDFPIRTRTGEERHWSFSASSPGTLRDGRRFIIGMAVDITERRETEVRQAFLLKLSDALRPLTDPTEMKEVAAHLLGEHLDVDRAAYAELLPDGEHLATEGGWLRPGVPSVAGVYRIVDFEAYFHSTIRNGPMEIFENAANNRGVPAGTYRGGWGAIEVRAAITYAVSKEDRVVAIFYVHSQEARHWSDYEKSLVREVGERTWEAVERARAQNALRENEERLAVVLKTLPVGVAVMDARGTVTLSNEETRRYLPTKIMPSRDEDRLARWSAWHSDGRRVERHEFPGARALRGECVLPGLEMLYTEDDGREVWTRVSAVPLQDGEALPKGAVVVMTDIDQLKRTADALRASEQRFRLFVQNVHEYALFQADPEGRITSWNPGAERLFGYTTAEMLGQNASRMLTPDDQQAEALQQEIDRVLRGERQQDERWLVRKDGSRFWAQWVTEAVHDEAGRLLGVAKILRDESERKQAEERQRLLIGELNHRVKNTLATVQSIASQTLHGSIDLKEFTDHFGERLQALSSAHNLLTRTTWEGADMRDLVREQLTLEGDKGRVSASGPPAFLDAQSSLALALVLHELGTNARKYGALSSPEGFLNIDWNIRTDMGEARLHLDWTERGGPPVRAPEKKGFGTKLITLSLRSVRGRTDLRFEQEGVRCHIELPLGSGPGEGLSRKDMVAC